MLTEDLVALLEKTKATGGKINNKIAMISIADGFGVELLLATRKAAKNTALSWCMTRLPGVRRMTPVINEAKGKGADTFVAYLPARHHADH